MATSNVLIYAKHDAVKFSALVNGKRRTIFVRGSFAIEHLCDILSHGGNYATYLRDSIKKSIWNCSKTYDAIGNLPPSDWLALRRTILSHPCLTTEPSSTVQYGYITCLTDIEVEEY